MTTNVDPRTVKVKPALGQCSTNAGLMLAQGLQRWTNIKPELGQWFVLADYQQLVSLRGFVKLK